MAKANRESRERIERTRHVTAQVAAALSSRSPLEAVMPLPKNKLEQKQQQASLRTISGPHEEEMSRIVSLPIVENLTPEEVIEFSREHVLASAHANGFTLYPTQAQALHEYITFGGILAPIAVGWGKTLISLMISHHAFNKEGMKKIMLCIPPEVLPQFEHDLRVARTWVPLAVPVFILGGKTRTRRRQLAASRKTGLYVVPYSLLSTTDTEENLKDINPGLIIADEAHKISRAHAARTKRMRRYLQSHPDVKLVALSGTITSKSLRDYWHLSKAALGNRNPLPNILEMANEWSDKIDSKASSDGRAGPLKHLVDWARKHFPEEEFPLSTMGFRRAYRHRLVTAPGVVSSGETDIGTSLLFQNRNVRLEGDGAEYLKELITTVVDEWQTPNGDEIEFAMHAWKWLFELSAGFYNELFWPTPEVLASRKGWEIKKARSVLEGSKKHFLAGQEYAKVLRDFLKMGRAGLDTPMAVGSFMHQQGDKCVPRVPRDVYETWCAMRALDFPDRIDRDSRAVRICPYKIHDAAEWCRHLPKGKGAIIWTYHQEMGQWAYDVLREEGLPNVLHAPAGANELICNTANADKIVVASVSAHHTGKNLQHFEHQLAIQWPRPANVAEQMLGRTHRNGQKADEIVATMQLCVDWDHYNFAACLNDAIYIHQTTGNRQKLVYGTYGFPPRIFSPEKLKALGCDPKILTADQRKLMQEQFGEFE
jgi:hypothetical protein